MWGTPWISPRKRGLRPWVLVSLGHSPKTGAELIDEMEKMSHGWWRPSPGSIYPLLEELAREGSVRRREDGRYELTRPSRDRSGWPGGAEGPRSVEEAVRELSAITSYLEDLGRSDAGGLGMARSGIEDVLRRLEAIVQAPGK